MIEYKIKRTTQFSKYEREATIPLNGNEIAASLNIETGEITKLELPKRGRPKKSTSLPDNMKAWLPNTVFQKSFPSSWEWLQKQTSDLEFKCAVLMGIKAEAFTNSLKPMNDDFIQTDIAASLNIPLGMVNYTMRKLFTLGVFGRFSVAEADKPYSSYWLFNPYLSFNGKFIPTDIENLFSGTYIAMAHRGLKFDLVLPDAKHVKKSKTITTPIID